MHSHSGIGHSGGVMPSCESQGPFGHCPPASDPQQHGIQQHQHQHQQAQFHSISPSTPSSTVSGHYLGTAAASSYHPQDYQNTFTDAQMAELIANVTEASAPIPSSHPLLNESSGSGGNPSVPIDGASSPLSQSTGRTASSKNGTPSRLMPAALPPSHLISDVQQHLQATPTRYTPYLGGAATLYGSPLSSSPTLMHPSDSPVAQLQTLQPSRSGDQPSGLARPGSGLIPKRSDSAASIGGTFAPSADSSQIAKLEAATSDRGNASPQEVNKDADSVAEKRQSTRFVYKLMTMVSDPESQHLISFNPSGTSVIVTNFDDFAKDVLPKHFKHSNFSSFIRQLNMYGFYKVNKTPRGQRHSNDSQLWEFSHPKFIRGRADLLDEIRRKALDNDHARVEARDLQLNMSLGHLQLRNHLEEIQWRLDQAMEQNNQLRDFSASLRKTLIDVLEYIKTRNGGHLPFDVSLPPMDVLVSLTPMMSSTPFLGADGGGSGGQSDGSGWDISSQHLPGQYDPLHGGQQDGPSIFITEPGYTNVNTIGRPRLPPGHTSCPVNGFNEGQAFKSIPPSPSADGSGIGGSFSMANFQHVSPLGSRRVSNASSNGRSYTSELPGSHTASDFGPSVLLNHSGVPIMTPSSTRGTGAAEAGLERAGNGFNSSSARPLTAPSQECSTVAGGLRGNIAAMPRRSLSRQHSGLAVETTSNFESDIVHRQPHSAVEGGSPSMFGGMANFFTESGGGNSTFSHPSMVVPPSLRGQFLLQQGGGLFASAVNTPLPPSPAPQGGMQTPYPSSPMPDGVFDFLSSQHLQLQQQAQHGSALPVGPGGGGAAMGLSDNGVSPNMLSHRFTPEGVSSFNFDKATGEIDYKDLSGFSAGNGGDSGPNLKSMRTPLKRTASSSAGQTTMGHSVVAAASEVGRSSSSMGKRRTPA